ncbi:serine/threonine protein kinase [candidate division KSB1 bacterium]|nr:serine/threonine protein kinase [candidate division KSB1 bacterium]
MQRLFEKFDIERCLKKDDYTAVYIARHIFLSKQILLKTLCCQNLPDQTVLHRFKREAKILAQLDHPNIIKVLDFGMFAEYFYISFEFFPGNNLRQVQRNKLNEKIKRSIFVQILQGIHYAHSHNVIHRDIKPENILVGADYSVKVADFGLALLSDENQMTQKSSIVGTPGYMSPEQIRGEKPSPQSDLFSLGVVALELFCGKNPFLGPDVGTTINNILTANYGEINTKIASLPQPIDRALSLLLVRDRRHRAGSAIEILSLLGIIPKIPPTTHGKKRKFVPVLIGISGIILMVLQVATAILERNRHIAEEKPESISDTTVTFVPEKPVAVSQKPPVVDSESMKKSSPDIKTTGYLAVMCLPWADVFIDSTRVATTPMEKSLTLNAGMHEILLKHPNYPIYRKKIQIDPNIELLFKVNFDTLFGYLDCKVYPWAKIYVDGQFKGHTPTAPIILDPGEHLLALENPNFQRTEQPINITRQDTLDFRYRFEKE